MNTVMHYKYLIILVAIILLSSCDEVDPCDDFPNCNTTPPAWGEMEVNVTISDDQPAVALHFYQGKRGDSLIYDETATSDYETYNLPVGPDITATATYYRGLDTIVAVDKAQLTVDEESGCGHTCYTMNDARFRLELKE